MLSVNGRTDPIEAETYFRNRSRLAALSTAFFHTHPEQDRTAPPAQDDKRDKTLMRILERIGCGYLVVDQRRRVVEANAAACAVLARHEGTPKGADAAFQRLMSVAKARIRAGSSSWIATSLKDELAVVLAQTDEVTSDGTSIVFILDLDAHPEPNPTTLRQMFGLTVAETRLALQIARGNTPSEIARTRRLSRTTIRSQLASVFAKTQTGRQAELVALLARIAMLP